jgi:hypothetical protein
MVEPMTGPVLGDFAKIVRGIATGANEFFFLTSNRAAELALPPEFVLPAVGRTRDVSGNRLTARDLADLSKSGRPTLLFSPDGRSAEQFPDSVQDYLRYGEEMKLHERELIKSRRPWYKMEMR